MNKSELINEVSQIVSTKKDAQSAVDCVFATITKALQEGESVTLVGFGTFKVNQREGRMGRNPQTGEALQIAARKVPKFTPGKALKDAVN